MRQLGRVGVIGRFKPLHSGSAAMLDILCQQADRVVIGIGSSNKYNARNPFTAEESREMIDLYLKPRFSNYEFLLVPDFGHIPEYSDGQKWKGYIVEHYGRLDYFVTGNEYVASLLEGDYPLMHPASLLPRQDQIYIKGSIVRMAMATGYDHSLLVPPEVSGYLDENGLVERFRREFGLETLAQLGENSWKLPEDYASEKSHTREKGGA
jgi:nicotinamide-nucleotide adenylyltransferase